jgi:hypothetical protein
MQVILMQVLKGIILQNLDQHIHPHLSLLLTVLESSSNYLIVKIIPGSFSGDIFLRL